MGLDKEIKDLVLAIRDAKRKLEENIAQLRQRKLDQINFLEEQAIKNVRNRYALKRSDIEAMPINGSLGLQQKIAALEEKMYMLHAQRIKDTTTKTS